MVYYYTKKYITEYSTEIILTDSLCRELGLEEINYLNIHEPEGLTSELREILTDANNIRTFIEGEGWLIYPSGKSYIGSWDRINSAFKKIGNDKIPYEGAQDTNYTDETWEIL